VGDQVRIEQAPKERKKRHDTTLAGRGGNSRVAHPLKLAHIRVAHPLRRRLQRVGSPKSERFGILLPSFLVAVGDPPLEGEYAGGKKRGTDGTFTGFSNTDQQGKTVNVLSIPLLCQFAAIFFLQVKSRFLREARRVSKALRTACHSSASCLKLWNSNDRDSRC
jgi:hypothetical protein